MDRTYADDFVDDHADGTRGNVVDNTSAAVSGVSMLHEGRSAPW